MSSCMKENWMQGACSQPVGDKRLQFFLIGKPKINLGLPLIVKDLLTRLATIIVSRMTVTRRCSEFRESSAKCLWNLDREFCFPDCGFPQSLRAYDGIVSQIRPWPLFSIFYKSIIHQSSDHSTLYNLGWTEIIIKILCIFFVCGLFHDSDSIWAIFRREKKVKWPLCLTN
jgi:hypothetical protein